MRIYRYGFTSTLWDTCVDQSDRICYNYDLIKGHTPFNECTSPIDDFKCNCGNGVCGGGEL